MYESYLTSTILLAAGLIATFIGGYWLINSTDSSFPFGAAFLFFGGMIVGLIGLAFGVISLVTHRRSR